MGVTRCAWVRNAGPEDVEYHDREWGVPVRDDGLLFELLTLEGAQAGLSWSTVLRKREGYRRAFAGFDPLRVARFDGRRIERLLQDPGIVRNRLKVESTITNARAFVDVQEREGSFGAWLWDFVDGRPLQPRRRAGQVPAFTELSDRLSRELKARGFRFVGTTICYAYMQAAGLVNDHTVDCFRHAEVARLG